MGKSRTPAQASKQTARTARNKVKKYQKLIAERPNDKHRTFWDNQLKFNS
jgi:hypothetical protein